MDVAEQSCQSQDYADFTGHLSTHNQLPVTLSPVLPPIDNTTKDDYDDNQGAIEANDHERISEEVHSRSSSDCGFTDSSDDELSQRYQALRKTDDELSSRHSPDQELWRRFQALRKTDDEQSTRHSADQESEDYLLNMLPEVPDEPPSRIRRKDQNVEDPDVAPDVVKACFVSAASLTGVTTLYGSVRTPEDGSESEQESRTEKWKKGIRERFYLMLYQSRSDEEAVIFKKDCVELLEVLEQKPRDESSTNSVIVDLNSMDTRFLELIVLRERKIITSLVEFLKMKFEWREEGQNIMPKLLFDIYSRLRLIKALPLVKKKWDGFIDSSRKEITPIYYDVVEVVLKRWTYLNEQDLAPSEIGKLLSSDKNKRLADAISREDVFLNNYFEELERCNMKKIFTLRDTSDAIKRFADDLFCISIFVSGFPTSNSESFITYYDKIFCKCIQNCKDMGLKERYSGSEKERQGPTGQTHAEQANLNYSDSDAAARKSFSAIVTYLAGWNNGKDVPDQWIWIHVSRHSSPHGYLTPHPPFDNATEKMDLACELFTRVVLTSDYCFPKASCPSDAENVCEIRPNKGKYETDIDTNSKMSTFTKLLLHAFGGFDSLACRDIMRDFHNKENLCCCSTCDRPNAERGNCITISCTFCTELNISCAKEGFVFSSHLKQYFEHHICDRFPKPHVSLMDNKEEGYGFPLAIAYPKAGERAQPDL